MQMTNEEIVRDYMQASNKQKQVRILADLNAASPSEILTVLASAGVEGVKMPEKIMPRKQKAGGTAAPAAAPCAAVTVYDRIEAILAALPEDAPAGTRSAAGDLVAALFRDYIERRLGKGGMG